MNTASLTLPSSPLPGDTLAGPVRAWYCLRVAARREHVAAMNLIQRTGLPTFAPRLRLKKFTRNHAVSFSTEALFPGYIFSRFSYPHDSRHVASTPGVLGLVSFGGPPPAIRDEIIEFLDTETKQAGAPRMPVFEEGSWVRIAEGCFRGSEGRVVQGGPAALRICVLMNLLGQDVQISIPAEHLVGMETDQPFFPAGLRNSARSPSPIPPQ